LAKYLDSMMKFSKKSLFGKVPNYATFNEGLATWFLLWVAVDNMNKEKIVWRNRTHTVNLFSHSTFYGKQGQNKGKTD
jgi:hypothetical protein